MADPFSNIEESFKNAFEHWDAPHSPSEMNAGWNQVSAHLPQVPGTHAPSAGHAAGHVAGSIGKIIGFSGLGLAVVTTAVVLYNIYVRPAKPTLNENGKTPAKAEHLKPALNPVAEPDKNTFIVNSGSIRTADKGLTNNNKAKAGWNSANLQGPVAANNPRTQASLGFANPQTPFAPSNNHEATLAKPQPSKVPVQAMKLFLSDTVICIGTPITSSSNISDPNVVIEWGDGKWNFFSGQNIHVYTHAGTFRAHLTIDSIRTDRIVTVLETPKAKLIAHQGENFSFTFDNRSLYAKSYSWNFGDGSPDEPGFYSSHTYTDTGRYRVHLVALSSSGCTDTAYQYINVENISEPEITSNVISPNGDGKDDDVWVNIKGETSFQFAIVDATGRPVFQTTDKNQHWKGKNQFTGADCKAGTYFYTITYRFLQNGDLKTKPGTITLIR